MHTESERFEDEGLQAAWQEMAAEAARQAAQDRPWLQKLLATGGAALAARYALCKRRLEQLRPGQRRALQRRLGVSLAGAALLLALAASPGLGAPGAAAPGATITVDQTSGAIAVDGACSLAEAINNANGDSQYSAVAGECDAGSGADTITLDTYVTLTVSNNSTFGPTGLPVVTSAITIEGQGNTISRSSGSDFRILAVGSGGNLTLNSATVSAGVATGSSPANRGGGIYVSAGLLTVTNSAISGNSATYGGGIHARSAMVAVSNSTLSGNSANNGGGIRVESGTVSVSNSTLSGNSAGFGGGMRVEFGTVSVSNSTISGNSGGGIRVGTFGTVTVLNSIVAVQSAGADCSNAGTLTSGGYNIESGTSCGFTGTGDQQSVSSGSLNLGSLAPNGGPTQTRALSSPSVAIDQIPDGVNGCAAGVSTDQRGAVRADGASRGGAGCDVGAYEYDSNQKPTAIALRSLSAVGGSGGAPAGWWGVVLAGLGGLGLSAFIARRQGWRRQGSGHSASAPPYSAPPLAAPLAVEAATLADASAPAYTPPAIVSRGQLKQFAGSPLVVDPLALPDP